MEEFSGLGNLSDDMTREERVKHYNKLVRDKIPEILHGKGVEHKVRAVVSVEEYENLKRRKLQEEVDEFFRANNVDELVDVLEVVYLLAEDMGTSPDQLEFRRSRKLLERGGFNKKLVLVSTAD